MNKKFHKNYYWKRDKKYHIHDMYEKSSPIQYEEISCFHRNKNRKYNIGFVFSNTNSLFYKNTIFKSYKDCKRTLEQFYVNKYNILKGENI